MDALKSPRAPEVPCSDAGVEEASHCCTSVDPTLEKPLLPAHRPDWTQVIPSKTAARGPTAGRTLSLHPRALRLGCPALSGTASP